MAVVGAIKTGIDAGGSVVTGTLQYTKTQYDEKISELEGHNAQLEQHLAQLEGLKSSIPGFWNDEKADKTIKSIETAITQVKSASERVQNLRKTYEDVVNELETKKTEASGRLDEAHALLTGLEIMG